jgi:hypothetical protein
MNLMIYEFLRCVWTKLRVASSTSSWLVSVANSIALVIRCHHVVRHDGDLASDRWGIARKRKLVKEAMA